MPSRRKVVNEPTEAGCSVSFMHVPTGVEVPSVTLLAPVKPCRKLLANGSRLLCIFLSNPRYLVRARAGSGPHVVVVDVVVVVVVVVVVYVCARGITNCHLHVST